MTGLDYRVVRAAGRFDAVRTGVREGCRFARRGATERYLAALADRRTVVTSPALADVASGLARDGLATGLRLDEDVVRELREYADRAPLFADRDPTRGFLPHQRAEAEAVLGKPILVAQHLNARRDCGAVARLALDPALARIATAYLGSVPTLVGTSLWWTYPVDPTDADRDLHAHRFHRDVDDFGFVKFFFYLTDVEAGDGAHVCVRGSHRGVGPAGRFGLRRFTDEEVAAHYPAGAVTEITGRAGDGFAEDTFCVHKGLTPTRTPRLLLQLEFALFDHGVAHDTAADTEMLV